MKTCIAILILVIASALNVLAQSSCTTQPGFVCLSQSAANRAAENTRELAATQAKVTVLETALADKDKIIADVQRTARVNEADLKAENVKLLADVAEKTGQIIQLEADKVRWTAVIDLALKHTQKSCKPFSVCF